MKSNVVTPSHYAYVEEETGTPLIALLRLLDYDSGNAIKYIVRAGRKFEMGMTQKEKAIEDLEKALWHIKDRIAYLKGETKP